MKLTRRDALAALAASTAVGLSPATVLAQAAEKPKLTLGVGGKPLLYYLPLTVAEKKGYFKDQGSTSRSTISAAAPSRCRRSSAARSMS